MAHYFARRISKYDFWSDTEMWPILRYYGDAIERFLETGEPGLMKQMVDTGSLEAEVKTSLREQEILQLWRGLSVLPRQYEEVCREWFLPTALGLASSYPYEG